MMNDARRPKTEAASTRRQIVCAVWVFLLVIASAGVLLDINSNKANEGIVGPHTPDDNAPQQPTASTKTSQETSHRSLVFGLPRTWSWTVPPVSGFWTPPGAVNISPPTVSCFPHIAKIACTYTTKPSTSFPRKHL